MWKSWYFHRCTSATVPCLWRMRRCLSGQSIPGRRQGRQADLRPDHQFRGCAGCESGEPAPVPQKLRRPGRQQRGGSYGNGSGNGGAGGYRNAGNGYGQYQNDGMNSSSMSVGQTGQAAGQMQSGQRTQANGTPQKKGMPAGAGSSSPIWRPIRPESRNCCRPLRIPTGMTMW